MSDSRMLSLDSIPRDPLGLILDNCSMPELAKLARCNSGLRKIIYAYNTKFALKSNPQKTLTYQQYAQLKSRILEIDMLVRAKKAAMHSPTAEYYITKRINPNQNITPYQKTISSLAGFGLGLLLCNYNLAPSQITLNTLAIHLAIYHLISLEFPPVIDFYKNIDFCEALIISAGIAISTNLIGMNQTFNYAAGIATSIVIKSKIWLPQESTIIFDLLHNHYLNSFYDNFYRGVIGSFFSGLPLNLISANTYLEGLVSACNHALKAGLITGTISAISSSISTMKDYIGLKFFKSRENTLSSEISDLVSEKKSYAICPNYRA